MKVPMMNQSAFPKATRPVRPWITVCLAVALAGCSVTPELVSQDEINRRTAEDRLKMYANQEPITGPLTFHDAAARALKYNLDYRLKMMEAALSQGALDLSHYDMLPKLLASAGYVTRNNEAGGSSALIEPPRTQSLAPSTSVEKSRRLGDVEFSWNLLDFGASYYRAKQNADSVMIADERRRKVLQNILQDVRAAYWRALGAQRLVTQMDALMERTSVALARARQVEQQGLIPQPTALAYQRALLDATTLLQTRRQDLELAQAELGALMNLAPGMRFTLADAAEPSMPPLPTNIGHLEDQALRNRPELREEDYKARITSVEVKKNLLSALPGIQLDLGAHYDSNKYLYNNSWADAGVRVSMNLFRLAAIPAMNRTAEVQKQVDDARRMALSMAVLTQTRVAVQRYGLALADLEQAEQGSRVDQRLLNYARSAASSRVDSELEVIRNEARSLLSQYQRHVAYANAQSAWGRLYNTIGLDVIPQRIESSDVKGLSRALEQTMGEWERATFKSQPKRTAEMPAVRLTLDQVDESMRPVIKKALTEALSRASIPVTDERGSWRLVAKLNVDRHSSAATRKASWQLSLVRPDGKPAGTTRYQSVLSKDFGNSTIDALTQSAVDANAKLLNAWMVAPDQPAFAESNEGKAQ